MTSTQHLLPYSSSLLSLSPPPPSPYHPPHTSRIPFQYSCMARFSQGYLDADAEGAHESCVRERHQEADCHYHSDERRHAPPAHTPCRRCDGGARRLGRMLFSSSFSLFWFHFLRIICFWFLCSRVKLFFLFTYLRLFSGLFCFVYVCVLTLFRFGSMVDACQSLLPNVEARARALQAFFCAFLVPILWGLLNLGPCLLFPESHLIFLKHRPPLQMVLIIHVPEDKNAHAHLPMLSPLLSAAHSTRSSRLLGRKVTRFDTALEDMRSLDLQGSASTDNKGGALPAFARGFGSPQTLHTGAESRLDSKYTDPQQPNDSTLDSKHTDSQPKNNSTLGSKHTDSQPNDSTANSQPTDSTTTSTVSKTVTQPLTGTNQPPSARISTPWDGEYGYY